MLSRRTVMEYTGLAWLVGLFADCGAVADGGSEQLPTNIEGPNPWDIVLGEGDDINPPWYPITRLESWMPKDRQTVLLATDGGGPCIWVATFYAGDENSGWCFITSENNNEILRGQLGDKYCWMSLPASPYDENWDHDDDRGMAAARDQKIVDEFIAKKKNADAT